MKYELRYRLESIEERTEIVNVKRGVDPKTLIYVPRRYQMGYPVYVRQIGGPWATGKWFDLHRGKHGMSDVFHVRPREGDVFYTGEAEFLVERLQRVQYNVLEHWNGGAGSTSLSIRISNREKDSPPWARLSRQTRAYVFDNRARPKPSPEEVEKWRYRT